VKIDSGTTTSRNRQSSDVLGSGAGMSETVNGPVESREMFWVASQIFAPANHPRMGQLVPLKRERWIHRGNLGLLVGK